MLIRQKRLSHNEKTEALNREYSREGRARFNEGEKLQASVQGSMSDLARKHDQLAENGDLTTEQMEQDFQQWDNDLRDQSPNAPQTMKNRGGWKRVGKIVPGKGYVVK